MFQNKKSEFCASRYLLHHSIVTAFMSLIIKTIIIDISCVCAPSKTEFIVGSYKKIIHFVYPVLNLTKIWFQGKKLLVTKN